MKLARLGLAAFLTFTAGAASAAIVNAPVPSNLIVSASGFEWAWAAPCSPTGCNGGAQGVVDLTYQGTQGWRLPTVAEITGAVTAAGGTNAWAALFSNGATCAAKYFNNDYSHCDGNDAQSGYIYNLAGAPDANDNEETFVLRAAAVPIPAAGFLLIGGLGALAATRRKKKS